MLKLPKEHLSVSQINLWESDPIAYQKKYFIGIEDPPSPFLEFGKQFAKDIEDYAAGVQRDFNFPEGFLDVTLIYPHVEYTDQEVHCLWDAVSESRHQTRSMGASHSCFAVRQKRSGNVHRNSQRS